MEDYQKAKVKRYAIIGGTVVIAVLLIIGFIRASGWLVKNTYDPRDVVADMGKSEVIAPEDKPLADMGLKTAEEACNKWNLVSGDTTVDLLVSKSSMLLTCEDSPFKNRVSKVEYSCGEISIGARIEWVFDDCVFGCVSTMGNGAPNVYTKSIPFTDEERGFLMGLSGMGNCKEDVVDGTYEIVYGV